LTISSIASPFLLSSDFSVALPSSDSFVLLSLDSPVFFSSGLSLGLSSFSSDFSEFFSELFSGVLLVSGVSVLEGVSNSEASFAGVSFAGVLSTASEVPLDSAGVFVSGVFASGALLDSGVLGSELSETPSVAGSFLAAASSLAYFKASFQLFPSAFNSFALFTIATFSFAFPATDVFEAASSGVGFL
jgi:hypothetical protein